MKKTFSDKIRLRAAIKEKFLSYSKEKLHEMSFEVIKKLSEQSEYINAQTIMLFHSLKDEIYTHDLIEEASKTKTVYLPAINEGAITPKIYKGANSLQFGKYNIQEPLDSSNEENVKFDLIIVPGVAFDKKGNRLGRGGGYYDRFLKKHKDTTTIAIAFPFQQVDEVPIEDFDIKISKVIC